MRAAFTLRSSLTAAAASTVVLLGACREAAGPSTARDASGAEPGVLQLRVAAGATQSAAGGAVGGKVEWSRAPGPGVVVAPDVIVVDDTVQAGRPARVTVNTVLPNGCWSVDGEDVRQSDLVLEITPRDRTAEGASGAPVICTMQYRWGAHAVNVTFAHEGVATIRVRGRLVEQGNGTVDEPITAERTIVVRR